MIKIIKLITLLTFVVLSGCYNNQYTEGNYNFPNKIAQLQVGQSRADVYTLLGPETIKSSFDINTSYYMYETSNRLFKFYKKKLIDAMIIIIKYNDKNMVQSIEFKNIEDRIEVLYDNDSLKSTLEKSSLIDDKLQEIDSLK